MTEKKKVAWDKSHRTIKLRQETAEKLRRLGYAGESYDDVLTRLLDKKEGEKKEETMT